MIQQKNILKAYFETGDKPTQSQYENLIDSLRHVYDDIPIGDIDGDIVTQAELENVAKRNEDNNFSVTQTLTGLDVNGIINIRKTGSANSHADTDLLVADSTAAISTAQLQILGGNQGISNLYFSDTDSYSIGGFNYNHETDTLKIRAADAEILTLNNTEITASRAIVSNSGFSTGANAANNGSIRLENGDSITSRNNANSGNRTLMYLDSSNVLQLGVGTDSQFGGDLSIVNTSANAVLNFNTSVGNARGFSMYNNGSNLYTKLMTNVGASFIWEAYDGTNVFSISSTGNIVAEGTATFKDNVHINANLTVGGSDNTGQPVTFYQKDDNIHNGWYVGYTGPAGNEFGIYGYETDGNFKIFTNNTLGFEIDENQAIQTHGNLTINQGSLSANANSGAQHLLYSDTADAPLNVRSGDSATGIAFQDNNGTSHIFYWGSGDYFQAESDWWVAGDIKSRGGDIYAGRFGSHPADSGSYYLLENVDATWGTDAYGFRLHLNGDTNDFSLEAASDVTTDTIFSVDRDVSGDFILQRGVVMKNNLTIEGGNVDMHGMLEFSQDNGAKIRLNRTGYHQYTIQQSSGVGLSFYDNDHGDESLYLYGDSAVVNGTSNGGYNFKVYGTANITSSLGVDGSIIVGGLVDNSVFPAPPALAPAFQISHNTTSEEVEISAAHGVIALQDETRTELSTAQLDSADDKVLVSKEWVVQYVASQLT